MKKLFTFALIATLILQPGLALDGVADEYVDEWYELTDLLSDWDEIAAESKHHPIISSLVQALLQLMNSDPCYQVKDQDIADLASQLASVLNSLSYPCEDHLDSASYQVYRSIDRLVRDIKSKAERIAAIENPPLPPTPTDVVDVITGDPDKEVCTVKVRGRIVKRGGPDAPYSQHPFFYNLPGRFDEIQFSAVVSPVGGVLTWTATEDSGHRTSVQDVNFEDGEYWAWVSLSGPTPPGSYSVTVTANYVSPDGAACSDSFLVLYK